MAVTTKKIFPATTNSTTTAFSPVGIQLNNKADLDVYVTLSGGTRVLQLQQSTTSTAVSSHPQVNDTTGLYFPPISVGTSLFNYVLSTDNNTITFNTALPSGAVVTCERRTRDASGSYTAFANGSTIRAKDLNDSAQESNFTAQDGRNKAFELENAIFGGTSPTINGTPQPFVDSSNIIDGSIATADIANSAITNAKLATDSVTSDKISHHTIAESDIADNAIATRNIVNLAVTTAKINDSAVVNGKIANDAVNGSKIADNSIDSEHYVDGSIDTAHISTGAITTAKISNSQVTSTKIADGNVNTNKLASSSVTTNKIANNAVTTDKIANDGVSTSKIADAELKTLAGMQSATASKLASSTALTADIADLNQIDGLTKQTTISDTDTSFPTSGAVVDYVAAQLAPLGGLEVIATEVLFPNTQPSAGVVISISDAGGVVFNGSGTSTTGRTVGGSTVTINGAPSSLNGETLAAGVGLMVSSTGSSQTYNYHKILGKEDDIKQLSDDINDFAERYRVGASNPTTSLHAGDLFFNTSTSKLLVYNATNTAWEEAQSIGNFFISTLSPAFDGSTQDFTITNAPANAEQIILSINGVVQKPNSGTSTPSEGFALSGSTVKLAAAPASGSDYFAVVIGSTVNIGTPSNNTVTTAILQNGSVTTAKIADDSVTGDKIANNLDIPDNNKIRFGTGNDLRIYHNGTHSYIEETGQGRLNIATNQLNVTNANSSETLLNALENGAVSLYYDNTKRFETTSIGAEVTGRLQVDGDAYFLGQTSGRNIIFDKSDDALEFADNAQIRFGAGDDFRLYHDGTRNRIDSLNHDLTIKSGNIFKIVNGGGTEDLFRATVNGAVELFYDSHKKFETTSTGVIVNGDLVFGNASSYDIQLQGGKIYGDDTAVNTLEIRSTSGNPNHSRIAIGEVTNHDNGGIVFYGATNSTAEVKLRIRGNTDTVEVPDNHKYVCGDGSDLQIYHDGSHSYVEDTGTGQLRLKTNLLAALSTSNEVMLKATENGAVELYYDNSKKLETSSLGAVISGGLLVDTVAPVADVGNVNNYTYGYFNTGTQQGLTVRGDEAAIEILASDQSHHAGSFVIRGGNEGFGFVNSASNDRLEIVSFTASGDGFALHNVGGNVSRRDLCMQINKDGSVELYHDGTKKFETSSGGGDFTVGNGEVDIYSTGSGSQHSLRLLNSNASAGNEIGIQFGPANNVVASSIQGISESDFTTTANRDGALGFTTRSNGTLTEAVRLTSFGELRAGHDGNSNLPSSSDRVNCIGAPNTNNITSNLARLVIQERTGSWISFKQGGGSHFGTISQSGSGVTYGSNSDYRLKDNVADLTGGITLLKQLRPVTFNWNDLSGLSKTETHQGFIAHEVQAIVPDAVTGEKDGMDIWGDCTDSEGNVTQKHVPESKKKDGETWTKMGEDIEDQQLDTSKLVPILTKALQEAIAKIEILENKVTALEAA